MSFGKSQINFCLLSAFVVPRDRCKTFFIRDARLEEIFFSLVTYDFEDFSVLSDVYSHQSLCVRRRSVESLSTLSADPLLD